MSYTINTAPLAASNTIIIISIEGGTNKYDILVTVKCMCVSVK